MPYLQGKNTIEALRAWRVLPFSHCAYLLRSDDGQYKALSSAPCYLDLATGISTIANNIP